MSADTSSIKQTYRITIDIEAMISAKSLEMLDVTQEHLHYYQALLQSLQAHPALLDRVLRSAAYTLKAARTFLSANM